MDILIYIFSAIGISAVAIPLAAWLAKKLIDSRISKDIELFKNEIKKNSDLELEYFKAGLQRTLKNNEIATSWLHEKRANLIIDLYSSLVDLNNFTRVLLGIFSTRNPSEIRSNTLEAVERVENLYDRYLKARIFLSEPTCKTIEAVLEALQDPTTTYYTFLKVYDDDELHTLRDVKDGAWKDLSNTIPPAMEKIERDFRKILGVEHS